ncbi:DUF2802 domain-containing protein [Methylobacter sp. Wu8]|uniref:Uncharacterized protein DUF2802 n=1 Tax=Methylobacter tundripaludum TaxID=173365 RepID=A0A2S6GR57_9GAMM|nr:DUF2802 domain-containing protein [Methylobacter tundripaludum]MCF7965428.1 DUF2802 domain-containing protein [Methylobacter tundripaludum]MCK9635905.1 DUF2802 domain-containing protein [Methylobacter tundripaludum]PPK67690.1 uncharacterized protein DUF2802 [Methylobacter tundripaludum]
MNNLLMIALIVEGAAIAIMLVALFWLARTLLKLKHDYHVLNDIVHGNTNDIAGLCSAALTVDSRIATVDSKIAVADEHLDDLAAKIAEVGQHDQSSHPYSGDIRKVRSGASVDELMQNSGLSHDEAALLIRLHGSKTKP